VPTHSYDALIIGGGIIGISVALELRRTLRNVAVVERSQPGREASYAAAGMLNAIDVTEPPPLAALARFSAELYPAYIDDLRSSTELTIDFQHGTALSIGGEGRGEPISVDEAMRIEPVFRRARQASPLHPESQPIYRIEEDWVDPRTLMPAAIECARHRDIHFVTGSEVTEIATESGRVSGVGTDRATYSAGVVINCAGAWSGGIVGARTKSRPVKGQMVSLLPPSESIRNVIRAKEPDVYMLPRKGGLIAVGATVEEAGFDKSASPDTAKALQVAAATIVPALAHARIHETWAGLRPASPDDLPVIGATSTRGYFIAGGHYRNGILLAPATGRVVAQLVTGEECAFDLTPFSPQRFESPARPIY
jgi:glycine oxidase